MARISANRREELNPLLPPRREKIPTVPAVDVLLDVMQNLHTFLSKQQRHVTEDCSAIKRAEALTAAQLSAVEVAKAFCHRATTAHQLVLI